MIKQTVFKFSKIIETEKFEKVLNSGKVWLLSSENFKRENGNF